MAANPYDFDSYCRLIDEYRRQKPVPTEKLRAVRRQFAKRLPLTEGTLTRLVRWCVCSRACARVRLRACTHGAWYVCACFSVCVCMCVCGGFPCACVFVNAEVRFRGAPPPPPPPHTYTAIWTEWLNDERTDASQSPQDIVLLFEAAVADVVCSADLWTSFAAYATNSTQAVEGGKEAVRGVYERALDAVGLMADAGPKVWAAYRQFECDELEDLEDDADSSSSGSSSDEDEDDDQAAAISAQLLRVVGLFVRQLSVPFPEPVSAAVLKEFAAFCGERGACGGAVPEEALAVHAKAKADWATRAALEEHVALMVCVCVCVCVCI